MKRSAREIGLLVILIVLCIITSVKNPQFLSFANIGNVAERVGIYGVLSIGVALIIITGGIDLSIGSMLAILGILLSIMVTDKKMSPMVAVPIMFGIAAFLGSLHGFLITKVKLQPFIVTLCGLLIYRGLARSIASDNTMGFSTPEAKPLGDLLKTTPLGLPIEFWIMIVLAVVVGIVLHRSVYGRYLYAVGRNEEAARYSGIETKRVIGSVYVVGALLFGVGAILMAFFTNSVSPASHGNSDELYAIAAAVLGGCSLRGGDGSIVGVVLGTILLQILRNLVNLLGVASSLEFAVVGTVILIGVIADRLLNKHAHAG
ncbi:ABC transporter permease [bacterium]|nr:MAG: ABC transporter permease [bacterium]